MRYSFLYFEKISKAIQSSYEVIKADKDAPSVALKRVQEAEKGLHEALNYLLRNNQTF